MVSAGEDDDEDEDNEDEDDLSEDGSFASVDDLDGMYTVQLGINCI